MAQEHPITPPPELLDKWAVEYWDDPDLSIGGGERYIAIQAAQWGADQELEACCEYIQQRWFVAPQYRIAELRAARRPNPPSLKEQALKQLECVDGILRNQGMIKTDTIRRALEALPDD